VWLARRGAPRKAHAGRESDRQGGRKAAFWQGSPWPSPRRSLRGRRWRVTKASPTAKQACAPPPPKPLRPKASREKPSLKVPRPPPPPRPSLVDAPVPGPDTRVLHRPVRRPARRDRGARLGGGRRQAAVVPLRAGTPERRLAEAQAPPPRGVRCHGLLPARQREPDAFLLGAADRGWRPPARRTRLLWLGSRNPRRAPKRALRA